MQGEFARYDGELLHNTTTLTTAVYLPALQAPPQVPLGFRWEYIRDFVNKLRSLFYGAASENEELGTIKQKLLAYGCNYNWYATDIDNDTLVFMFIETPSGTDGDQQTLQFMCVYCMSGRMLAALSEFIDWRRFHNKDASQNDAELVEFIKPFCVRCGIVQYKAAAAVIQGDTAYDSIDSIVVQCTMSSITGLMDPLQARLIALGKLQTMDHTDEQTLQKFAEDVSDLFDKQIQLCADEFSHFAPAEYSVCQAVGALHHLHKYIQSYQPPQTVLVLFEHKALQADHLYANLLQGAASNGLDMRAIWVPNNEFEHTNMDAASFASLVWKTLAEKQPELLQGSFSDQPVVNSGFGMGNVGIPYQRYEGTLAETTRQMKAIKNIMYDAWQNSSKFRVSNIVVMSETYILRRLQADGALHSIFADRDMLEVIFVFRRRPELRYAFSAAVGKRLLSETLVTRAKRSQMEHSRAVAWAEKEYYALYQLVKNTRLPTLPEKPTKETLDEKAKDGSHDLDESWIWTDYANQLHGTATLDGVKESEKIIDRWKMRRTVY